MATFGQEMMTVAVGWEIYERTHSPLALGLVGLTAFLPMVLMTLAPATSPTPGNANK